MSAVETAGSLTHELADLMEHEKVIEQGMQTWLDVSAALMAIKVDRKYLAAGYSTFEEYCRDRWQMSRQNANRLIAGVATVEAIERALPEVEPMGSIPTPTHERQVRPLAALDSDDEKAEAWVEAVERSDGEQPTAKTVAEVVEDRKPERTPKPVPKPKPKVDGKPVDDAPPHPATYSNAVLDCFRELLELHDAPNKLLIDPFAGTGRVHELRPEWSTVGVELEPEWAKLHGGTICGDSTDFAAVGIGDVQAGVVATSPAYGNRLADAFYDAADAEARRTYAIDLGRPLTENSGAGLQWGDEYRELHRKVWAECVDVLVPGGLFLLNCKDHRRNGELVAVTAWHVEALQSLGMRLIDFRSLRTAGLPFTTAAPLPELVAVLRKASDPGAGATARGLESPERKHNER